MTTKRTPRNRAKKPACPTCQGQGQVETFQIVGRGKNTTRIDTWALCLDCCGTTGDAT
jgi:DnaJ-class molecular chaperone